MFVKYTMDTRVHDMELRYSRTAGLPTDSRRLIQGEVYRQDKEDANKPDFIGGRELDNRIGISDVLLDLNSSQRDIINSDMEKGVIAFNLRSAGVSDDTQIGTSSDLHDIIFIESYSFILPELPCSKYIENNVDANCPLYGENNKLPILVYNSCPDEIPVPPVECEIAKCPDYLYQLPQPRIYMDIKETIEQSTSDNNGKKHNFTYNIINQRETSQTITSILAVPAIQIYTFTYPIKRFDTLTLTFRNSNNKELIFNNDLLCNVVLDALTFNYTDGPISIPVIPQYNEQYLEVVTPSINKSCNIPLLNPKDQIVLRNIKKSGNDMKLYNYLNSLCNKLLVGMNGYNPYKSFRLDPDIVITEFISGYSKRYNILNNNKYIDVSRTTKQLPVKSNQIVIREWKVIPQPYPLQADVLPPGDLQIDKFVESKYFHINNMKISLDDYNTLVEYNGNKYVATSIYYDRVLLTETTNINLPIISLLITQGGIISNIPYYNFPVPLKNKHKTIQIKPNQYVVEPNYRTDFTDVIENRNFTFNGQYINKSIPTVLIDTKIKVDKPGTNIRLFHQGCKSNIDGIPISDIEPLETNRIYHIESLNDIYADKIVLTQGIMGYDDLCVVISKNILRVPLRLRKLERVITNYIAP